MFDFPEKVQGVLFDYQQFLRPESRAQFKHRPLHLQSNVLDHWATLPEDNNFRLSKMCSSKQWLTCFFYEIERFIAQPLEFIIIFFLLIYNCSIFHVWFSRKTTAWLFLLYQEFLNKGTRGIEPQSSGSVVECSTTELRSLKTTTLIFQNVLFKTMLLTLVYKNRKVF